MTYTGWYEMKLSPNKPGERDMENNVNKVNQTMGNSSGSSKGDRIAYDPETRTFKTTNNSNQGIKATQDDLIFGR